MIKITHNCINCWTTLGGKDDIKYKTKTKTTQVFLICHAHKSQIFEIIGQKLPQSTFQKATEINVFFSWPIKTRKIIYPENLNLKHHSFYFMTKDDMFSFLNGLPLL